MHRHSSRRVPSLGKSFLAERLRGAHSYDRTLADDPLQRVGVGMSRLGSSEAVAIGAYAFALQKLCA